LAIWCASRTRTDALCMLILLELFEGREPFHECRSQFRIQCDVVSGKRPTRPRQDCERKCMMEPTDAMWALVQRCWHQDEDHRPTMNEVVEELENLQDLNAPRPPPIVDSILRRYQDVEDIMPRDGSVALVSLCDRNLVLAAHVKALGQALEDAAVSKPFMEYVSDLRDEQALEMMDVLQTVCDYIFRRHRLTLSDAVAKSVSCYRETSCKGSQNPCEGCGE
jgi:hypothetical protein